MMKNVQHLTTREFEILELISRGWSNPSIASNLSISINTVKYHLKRIFAKLQVKNRIEALNRFHEIEQSTI
jgi:ATP/maltotriose-dependent transcriptional regulator MalT